MEAGRPGNGAGADTEAEADAEKTRRPSQTFGRRGARGLSARQKALLREGLAAVALPERGPLDPAALFPGAEEVWLEAGFGGGEHLAALALRHPSTGFIGAEPFTEGVAKLLGRVEAEGLRNVRVHAEDVRPLLDRLPDAALGRAYVLFPDPWPKTRHKKRRLLGPAFLHQLARTLKPGAELRFATDVASYAEDALLHLWRHPDFEWLAEGAADWREPWAGHPATRYQEKGLGDCAPVWIRVRRV